MYSLLAPTLLFLSLSQAALCSEGVAAPFEQAELAVGSLDTGDFAPFNNWTNCGSANDALTIQSVDISPYPPQPGQNVSFTVVGEVSSTINTAYAELALRLPSGSKIQTQIDLCFEARLSRLSVQCPIATGLYRLNRTIEIPTSMQPGVYHITVEVKTATFHELACLDMNMLVG